MNNEDKLISTDNYKCEFGYELQLVIPYAYYLYKNNILEKTTSCLLTKELYYFSKNHNELHKERGSHLDNLKGIPNKSPHCWNLKIDKYIPPPYREVYKNTYFVYDKPLLIIHNKYNIEWAENPINYIDKKTLIEICSICKDKYKIIYLRPNINNIVNDKGTLADLNLNEEEIFHEYDVINGNDLYKDSKDKYNINNFNHFQLLLHSCCNKFISVQGGNSVIASYFGGTNIVYAVKGNELKFKSYKRQYKLYSGCDVIHVNKYKTLIKMIKIKYL